MPASPSPAHTHADLLQVLRDQFGHASFRLGQYLSSRGHGPAAAPFLADARRLHPESWSYRRQTWELEEPGKAGSAEFWAAVDALGDRPYYPPARLSR